MTSRMHTGVKAAGVVAALVVTTGMAGCAGSGPSQGSAGEVDGSTITIATIAPLKEQFQVYADAYEKAFPDRKVEIQAATSDVTEYTQKLATQRLSGSLPDIFFNVDFLANTLADSGVTLDLAPALGDKKFGLDGDQFLEQFVGQYRPSNEPDQVTALPVSADSTALVYNKTLFDEAGVTEYPQPDWTWDDYFRVATEIQEKSGGAIFGTVAPIGDGSQLINFGPVLTAYGVDLYDPESNTTSIGSPDALKAWESMLQFYGTASAPYAAAGDDPGYKFEAGTVAMAISSRGAIPTIRAALTDDEWDVTEVPTVEGKHASGGGSYGLSIGSTSKNQDAALAFLGWFYDPAGGLAVAQTPEGGGIIPPTLDGLEDGTWADADVPANIEVFATTARDAILPQQLPGSAGSTLTEATKKAVQQVLLEGRSAEDAFAEAEETVNTALQNEAK